MWLLDQDQCMTLNRLQKKIILACKRMVKIMMKRFTIILACTRMVQIMTKGVTKKNGICCEVYMNNSPTFKENWVASPPNRRSRAKYKMFPSVSVRVQHREPGNMYPYNFEIQAHSLSISIAKTYLGKLL